MDYRIEDISIEDTLGRFRLGTPAKLAVLPENIIEASNVDEFIFTETLVDLNKLFKINEVDFEIFGQDTEMYRSRKSADLYLPAFFVSLSAIAQNPNVISVVLNLLSNYIYDALKGSIVRKTATVEIYIETNKNGKAKKISYKGNAEGIKHLDKVIKNL